MKKEQSVATDFKNAAQSTTSLHTDESSHRATSSFSEPLSMDTSGRLTNETNFAWIPTCLDHLESYALQSSRCVYISGGSFTDRTAVVLSYLKAHDKSYFKNGIVLCDHYSSYYHYSRHMPVSCIYMFPCEQEEVFASLRRFVLDFESDTQQGKIPTPIFVVMDVSRLDKEWMNRDILRKLYVQYRQFSITLVFSTDSFCILEDHCPVADDYILLPPCKQRSLIYRAVFQNRVKRKEWTAILRMMHQLGCGILFHCTRQSNTAQTTNDNTTIHAIYQTCASDEKKDVVSYSTFYYFNVNQIKNEILNRAFLLCHRNIWKLYYHTARLDDTATSCSSSQASTPSTTTAVVTILPSTQEEEQENCHNVS